MNVLFLSKIFRLMEFFSRTGSTLNQHGTSKRKLNLSWLWGWGLISKLGQGYGGRGSTWDGVSLALLTQEQDARRHTQVGRWSVLSCREP